MFAFRLAGSLHLYDLNRIWRDFADASLNKAYEEGVNFSER
jgi:hypothetical protein